MGVCGRRTTKSAATTPWNTPPNAGPDAEAHSHVQLDVYDRPGA
jgi:hypothetical protein